MKIKNNINNKYIKIIWILFYCFIALLVLKSTLTYMDPDLSWHLQFGKEIIEMKDVPRIETHNFPLEGKKWVDHEWLTNLISYTIYSKIGFIALNIFFIAITIFTLILFNHVLLKEFTKNNKNVIFLLLFEYFGLFCSLAFLGIRMQVITQFFLVLLLIIIQKHEKTNNLRYLLFLLPMFYFWANLHGGFLIGYFILSLWIGIHIISMILKKFSIFDFFHYPRTNIKIISTLIIILILSFLVSLLTPYKTELYSFLYFYKNTFYLTHIFEWLPSYHWPVPYSQLFYQAITATFFIILFVDTIINYRKGTLKNSSKINFWYFSLYIVFFLLSIKSRRHFPLFFFTSFPVIMFFIKTHVTTSLEIRTKSKNNIFFILLILLLIVTSVYKITTTNFTNNPFTSKTNCNLYPCDAVEFLKSDPSYLDKNFYNDYNWGGFLVYVWPEKQIFLDGRLPIYTYKDHSIYEEYFEFYDVDIIEEKINEYDIKLILSRTPGKITFNWFEKTFLGLKQEEANPDINYLLEYLDNSSDWTLVYTDGMASVYTKD